MQWIADLGRRRAGLVPSFLQVDVVHVHNNDALRIDASPDDVTALFNISHLRHAMKHEALH